MPKLSIRKKLLGTERVVRAFVIVFLPQIASFCNSGTFAIKYKCLRAGCLDINRQLNLTEPTETPLINLGWFTH